MGGAEALPALGPVMRWTLPDLRRLARSAKDLAPEAFGHAESLANHLFKQRTDEWKMTLRLGLQQHSAHPRNPEAERLGQPPGVPVIQDQQRGPAFEGEGKGFRLTRAAGPRANGMPLGRRPVG